MPSALLLPSGVCPSNLSRRDAADARPVTSDLYNICGRLRDVSPRLYLLELDGDDRFEYAVMEHCDDKVERLVFKVAASDLDGRVIEKLRFLMAMPLDVRLAQIEREEYKFEAEKKEAELDELYERMGRPMWTQLEHDGFIQRPVSYPKAGVAGGRGSKEKT